jgi:Arc/MetJ-type ribon-helix-helix transcriptional regulator
MKFRKTTITVPEELYVEIEKAIASGLYTNITDIIRAGIRRELLAMKELRSDLSEKNKKV